MKTEWNLEKFFYSSLKDPRIGRDFRAIRRAYLAFERAYKGKTDYLKSAPALLKALQAYERFIETVGSAKPLHYVHYTRELNNGNTEAEAMLTRFSNELTTYENRVLFFPLSLGRIDKRLQRSLLRDARLKPYRYFLQKTFQNAKHNLSEAEEKIMNLKSLPAHGMWVDGVDRVVNRMSIPWGDRTLPINEAVALVSTLPTRERRALHQRVMQKLGDAGEFAESEMNAIVIDKKINDALRGFKEPYSATVLGYENKEKAVMALVEATTKSFPIAHRFYRLKAKFLKEKILSYADRSAPIGKTTKQIPFTAAAETVRGIFAGVDPDYGKIFDRFLTDGHIDVQPRVGKSGGAYCSSTVNSPTLVLLNHVDDFKSLMTLAHEMGHAVHAEMSKTQPILYQGHTISVAETASTLFENLVFDTVFKTLSPAEQIVALHDQINSDISTVFRQIAFFNFELELHRSIRAKGKLTKEEIGELLNTHMAAYLGPAVQMEKGDGNFFILVSHFRRFFYVYAYTYGQLISKAMTAEYRKDPTNFAPKIKRFLMAGESMSPEDIFKGIGIDTTDPTFFAQGIKSIEADIEQLEKLSKAA